MADPQTEWTRRKLQVLLGIVVVVTLSLTAGVVWTVVLVLHGGSAADGSALASGPSGQSARDQLATRRLPAASLEDAQPGTTLSTGTTGTMLIPAPMETGPAGVATGFPQTPQGALAQLAAIDSAALSSASVRSAQGVITGWAAPGGPTAETWSGVKAIAALLESAGMSSDGEGSIAVGVEPTMGLIKGTVGDDYVVPCVDFILTATLADGQPQQVAVADCQRMVWQDYPSRGHAGGRWVIGPGQEPAEAPSLWPGSQESFDASYKWLEVSQ